MFVSAKLLRKTRTRVRARIERRREAHQRMARQCRQHQREGAAKSDDAKTQRLGRGLWGGCGRLVVPFQMSSVSSLVLDRETQIMISLCFSRSDSTRSR